MRTSLLSQVRRGPSPMVWCLAVSGVLLLLAPRARAGGVVNNCTEADLRAALAGGGTVTFACDGTIVLTNGLVIAQDTVMDGSGRQVTLDGARTNRVLRVTPGAQFTMIGLMVANGWAQGTNGVTPLASGGIGQGGGLYNEGGNVTLLDCVFTNNVAKGGDGADLSSNPGGGDGGPGRGGAIMGEGGTVAATNCTFVASLAQGGEGGDFYSMAGGRQGLGGDGSGGAICLQSATSSFQDCHFLTNACAANRGGRDTAQDTRLVHAPSGDSFGGAIHVNGGRVELVVCGLSNNTNRGGTRTGGGAIHVAAGQSILRNVEVRNSTTYGMGGAISSFGDLLMEQCLVVSNRVDGTGAPGEGGGLYNGGTARVSASRFEHNAALPGREWVPIGFEMSAIVPTRTRAGAILNTNHLVLNGCLFAENTAEVPYGPYWPPYEPGARSAPGQGGAIYNFGTLLSTNTTFHANRAKANDVNDWPSSTGAGAYGGALCNAGTAVLVHQTFAQNEALGGLGSPSGVSAGGAIYNPTGTLILQNCILANSPSGGNVYGVANDDGNNLSSDATPVFTAAGSRNNTDPKLGPLGDYGGPTPTIPLFQGSPAIDAANPTYAPLTDQRGQSRPVGAGYDIGAFEGSLPGPPVLTMSFSPRSAVTGMVTTLSYVLDNPNASPLNNVSFTNWLPTALRVAADPGVVNGCGTGTVTAPAGGEYVVVEGVTLTNRQRCLIAVNITGLSLGVVTNTAGPISSAEGAAALAPVTAVVALIAPPTVATGLASDVQEHSLVFNGDVNPNGSATMAWFEYGPTISYGSQSSVRDMGSGYSTLVVSNLVADLPSYGLYHYRLVAQNDAGTVFSADATVRLLGLARTNLALRLDGTNDFVTVPGGGGLNGVSDGTIELWAQWNGVQPDEPAYGLYGAVFSRQGSFGLQDILALDNRHPAFAHVIWSPYSPSGAILGTTLVGDGVWRHIAVTFRPGGHRLYVDGVLQGTSTGLGVLGNDPAAVLRLGSLATTPDRFAACVVDEVRIWSGVRSPEEIAYFRTHPLDSSTSGLIAYWRLDEGSGLVAHDATGHGFDGTLVNGPVWATAGNPVDYGMTLTGAPADTEFRLRLIGQPGRPFVLESSADLLGWAGVLTNQFGVDCRFQYDAPPPSATLLRFYRIVAP